MRLMLISSLMFAPALLHAQTPVSQQLLAVNAPVARPAVTRPVADAPRRISTGVTAPKLLKSVAVVNSGRASHSNPQHVSVEFTVSKDGIPTNIKVTSAVDLTFAQNVAESVAQYRYEPGTLDGTPTDVPVDLELTVVPAN